MCWRNHDNIFSRFDRVPACDGRTDVKPIAITCFSIADARKNRPRNARVIIKNKVARFLWLTVYSKWCSLIDDDDDDDYRAAEFELQELKLSVNGQLRSRDTNVNQLQTEVNITALCYLLIVLNIAVLLTDIMTLLSTLQPVLSSSFHAPAANTTSFVISLSLFCHLINTFVAFLPFFCHLFAPFCHLIVNSFRDLSKICDLELRDLIWFGFWGFGTGFGILQPKILTLGFAHLYYFGHLTSHHWPSFGKGENKGSVLLWYSCCDRSILMFLML